MMFQKIILVGVTQLPIRCGEIAMEYVPELLPEVWDASARGAEDVMDKLCRQEAPALVLSIMNPRIFPARVVERQNLLIVNAHHGLLPGHRGRNAQAWSLFYEESVCGVTWHLVDKGTDTGAILKTVSIPVTERDTSLTLLQKQDRAIRDSLRKFLPELINGTFHCETPVERMDYLHKNADVPNQGMLEPQWSGAKISCFLRAMDFGPLRLFGSPRIALHGQDFVIKKYEIQKETVIRHDEPMREYWESDKRCLAICKDGYVIRLTLGEL